MKTAELNLLVTTAGQLEVTQSQVITTLLISALVTHTLLRIKYLRFLTWPIFAAMGLVGVLVSGWTWWLGFEHFSSVSSLWDALNVRNASISTGLRKFIIHDLLLDSKSTSSLYLAYFSLSTPASILTTFITHEKSSLVLFGALLVL